MAYKQRVVIAVVMAAVSSVLLSAPVSAAASANTKCVKQGTSYVWKITDKPAQKGRLARSVTTTATAPYYQYLAQGSTGDCVMRLQAYLNRSINANLTTTGQFGPKTEQAVRKLQAKYQAAGWQANGQAILVDGIVGPQTWALVRL